MDWKALYTVIERIPTCGCGDPSAAFAYVRKLMRVADSRESRKLSLEESLKLPSRWLSEDVVGVAESGPYYFILYALEKAGLTEHGTSIGGSWLTDEGALLMDAWQHVHDDRLADWTQMVFDRVYNPHCVADATDWSKP